MASELQRNRRRVGYAMSVGLVLIVLWYTLPGLPVLWAPRASAEMRAAGQALFQHEWKPKDPLANGDGLGPVFNAGSCVACHFQGGVGGGGANQHNVVAFQVLPTRSQPNLRGGLIHHFAVDPAHRETHQLARQLFPIEPGKPRTVDCQTVIPPFDPLRTETINSTALFGAGWIDRISARTIKHNQLRKGLEKMVKEFDLDFSTVPPGRPRILPDGRVGKFGWRSQFATLREFVAAACANELGLGNPLMEQAKPLSRPDFPSTSPDLNHEQFTALVAFVDTLPRPMNILPENPSQRDAAVRGQKLFYSVGCAICHVPDIGGVEGIYSDLLLHEIEDNNSRNGGYGSPNESEPPVPLPEGHPRPHEWKTPPLWGVADSAPYFHDGGSPTLKHAILRHGGDAARITQTYQALPLIDQEAMIVFLNTLKAPAPARE